MLTSTIVTSDQDYSTFERLVAERVTAAPQFLFATNAEGLWNAYLDGLPSDRQHYDCRCCRRFIESFGGLVTIGDDGMTEPIFWRNAPGFFVPSAASMCSRVARAKVAGVFVNGLSQWGTPFNVPGKPSKYEGQRWTHLHGTPAFVFKSALKTADQEAAEKKQDYIMLHKALADIPAEAVVQAVRVLEADVVDRSEKTLGVAKWLLTLHQSLEGAGKGRTRDNLVWLAVAKAPPGWCHVRSTMIGTLLDDVLAGLPFDAIKRRWNEKMHPLQYQRPTAPPKDGNIDQANNIMAKLQTEGALARRFARLDEVTALWKPREVAPPEKKPGGAFDHLKGSAQKVKAVELPAKAIIWEQFRDTVVPDALSVEVMLTGGNQAFYGLVTAVNPDAPPMLQWDGLEGLPRNPVSWYFWHGGSYAHQWGLEQGWTKVDAICLKPCHWQSDKFTHQGPGVFLVLSGARDSRTAGGGYFPETLRAEYHGIRSVIEAHSRQAELAGRECGSANGIALGDSSPLTVRVHTASGPASYYVSL